MKETAPVDCVTSDSWQFRRGQIDAISRLVAYEEYTKLGYDNIQD